MGRIGACPRSRHSTSVVGQSRLCLARQPHLALNPGGLQEGTPQGFSVHGSGISHARNRGSTRLAGFRAFPYAAGGDARSGLRSLQVPDEGGALVIQPEAPQRKSSEPAEKARGRLWAIVLAGGQGVRLRTLTRRVHGEERPSSMPRWSGRGLCFATRWIEWRSSFPESGPWS